VVGVIGVHGVTVQLCVVETLGSELDLALIHVLHLVANHVLEYTKKI